MTTRTRNRPDLYEDREPTTDHSNPPALPSPPSPPSPTDTPKLDLSLTQVLGGSLAAATAAALGSRLGVVGTITGAALVSVIASIAGAVYTTSLRRTKHQMARALGTVGSVRTRPPRPGPRVRMIAVGAAAVFALTAAGVTGAELLTGTSLSGRSGSTTVSTSLQGESGTSQQDQAPAPAAPSSPTVPSSPSTSPSPSISPTASPSESQSPTPTPDVPAPSTTDPINPNATPSPTATSSPSTGPGAGSSPSAEPPATGLPVTP